MSYVMSKKETTYKEVEDYVKQNFPDKEVWDFVFEAVVAQKEFLDSLDHFEHLMEDTENKGVEYHPLPPVLPSLGDGYDFFPSIDGTLNASGGKC